MTRPASLASTLAALLCVAGLACLAAISLVHPSTTRMYAWPWTLAYAGAVGAPILALIVRGLDTQRPLALPSRAWSVLAIASAATVLTAALLSPYAKPSVLWSAPLLAGVALFFVVCDWLNFDVTRAPAHRLRLRTSLLAVFGAVGAVSLGLFLDKIFHDGWSAALAGRNAFPLGHSNYVAGFAVLMLPLGAELACRGRRTSRWLAVLVIFFATIMLFTSGSRGGLIGLAVLALGGLWSLRLRPAKKILLLAVAIGAGVLFILANPRTRATFTGGAAGEVLTTSAVQRSAMFQAGLKMGAARPLLGWGPGTTPLAYPKFRATLDGGAENVLQLHSTPIHVWAEFGAIGLACLAGFILLVARDRGRDPMAALTLAAYGAFALTDWQMDIPLFAAVLAVLAALVAAPGRAASRVASWAMALGGIFVSAAVMWFGQRDPTPELNVRALTLARDPAKANEAIALLGDSLAHNPDQEIAHFNLGWLLLVRDPAAAERHFRAAAHLVPDKGGVYFGLGLAQLNEGRRDDAARAFALECLNDPRFLSSPWWREPAIAPLRDASAAALAQLLTQLKLTRISADQLGRVPEGPERTYRRTRTGYPVLMRNLDLAPPDDLFDVREAVAADESAQKLPPKGWLPSPRLLSLLDALPAHPPSVVGNPK